LAQRHILDRIITDALHFGRTALVLSEHPYGCNENALVIECGNLPRQRTLRGIVLSAIPWPYLTSLRRVADVDAKRGAAAKFGRRDII
jgi:hypothetical protein